MIDTPKNQRASHLSASEPCWWMLAGVVDYKLCDRQFDCEHCPFDLILQTGSRLEEPITTNSQFTILDTLFYCPGHVWLRVEDRGNVRVGLDDFAQKILGRIYAIALPHEGIRIEKGTHRWSVIHQAGETPLAIPISGVVIEVNWKLQQSPSLLNRDPYGAGWAFVIKPNELKTGLRDLFYGERAVNWNRAEIDKLYSLAGELSGTAAGAVTLPDGGSFKKDFLSELSSEQMRELIDTFLPGPRSQTNSTTRHSRILSSKRR